MPWGGNFASNNFFCSLVFVSGFSSIFNVISKSFITTSCSEILIKIIKPSKVSLAYIFPKDVVREYKFSMFTHSGEAMLKFLNLFFKGKYLYLNY